MNRLLLPFAALLLLAACTPQVKDDTPPHPTAVTMTRLVNHGFKGMFASESTRTVSTRADRRRQEDTFAFSGFVMKHLAGARDGAVIWRVDRDKQWRLDPKAKTYVECPLAGCRAPARPAQPEARPTPEERSEKPTCPLTLADHSFTVEATGQTKEINGFKTRLHKARWSVSLKDKAKKTLTSRVDVDVWTAPEDTPAMKAVLAVDREFEARVREKTADRSGMGQVIPPEAMAVITSQFLSGLSASQRSSITAASRELSKIHGRPVLTHLEWNMSGDACSEAAAAPKDKPKDEGLDLAHGLGGLLGSAASRGVQKKVEESADKPVFSFDEELLKMDVAPVRDGEFSVPASYKKAARD